MEPHELAGLSREDLLEFVRRQHEELAEREAAIERRDEKIRELEEELSQFRQPARTPDNSSVLPSRGRKAIRVVSSAPYVRLEAWARRRQPGAHRAECGRGVSAERMCGMRSAVAAGRCSPERAESGHG